MTVVRNGAHFDVYLDGNLKVSTDLDTQYATATGNVEIDTWDGIKDTINVTEPVLPITVSVPVKTVTNSVVADTTNAALKFTSDTGATVNGSYSDGVYILAIIPGMTGTLTVSQDGYDTLTQPLTATADTTISIIELQKTILMTTAAADGFDLSQQGYNKVAPPTGKEYVGGVYVGLSDKTHYTVSATFNDSANLQKRQGFLFGLGDTRFSMTINSTSTDYVIQSIDGIDPWNIWYGFGWMNANYLSTTGMTMTVVRNGAHFDVYLDGNLKVSTDLDAQYATAVGDVSLVSWTGANQITITEPTYQ